MDAKTRVKWQKLVDSFEMSHLHGLKPWDALLADRGVAGRSDGEKEVLRFLLGVWDPGTEWQAGPFNLFDALRTWDPPRVAAFQAWVREPWWP